jgi:hypothetical protein
LREARAESRAFQAALDARDRVKEIAYSILVQVIVESQHGSAGIDAQE